MSKKIQYFNTFMSIFQESVNVSIKLCQYFKKCQYVIKFMSKTCPFRYNNKKVGPSGRPFGAPSHHAGKVGIICYLEPGPPLYLLKIWQSVFGARNFESFQDPCQASSSPGQPQWTGQRLLPGPLAPACQASCPVRPFARVTCQASCTVLGVQRTFPDTKNQ